MVSLVVCVCVCAMCIDTPLFKAPSRHSPPLPQVDEYTSIVHHFGFVCSGTFRKKVTSPSQLWPVRNIPNVDPWPHCKLPLLTCIYTVTLWGSLVFACLYSMWNWLPAGAPWNTPPETFDSPRGPLSKVCRLYCDSITYYWDRPWSANKYHSQKGSAKCKVCDRKYEAKVWPKACWLPSQ